MPEPSNTSPRDRRIALRMIDLGRMSYANAYHLQVAHHEEVLAARDSSRNGAPPGPNVVTEWGRLLLVEHDPPVITISRRPDARAHLVATTAQLSAAGVEVVETDRGGDITYHGPGQLVVYPILDLNLYHLGLHAYMRLLEQAVIDTLAAFGIAGERDPGATGVWVRVDDGVSAKIAAMGVRVRRWVSMHGLALNVTTNLKHFQLIVPCGLLGRPVTSLHAMLGAKCPAMDRVKEVLAANIDGRLNEALSAKPSNSA